MDSGAEWIEASAGAAVMIGMPTYLGFIHASFLMFLLYSLVGGAAVTVGEFFSTRPDYLRDVRGACSMVGVAAATILIIGGLFFSLSLRLL